MKKNYMVLFLLILLTGCGYGSSKDHGNGLTDVNYHRGENVNQDMITDQNPNFLNLKNTDENSSTNNRGVEINKAKDVINRNNQFTPGSIWINGQKMHITVYSNNRLSTKQKDEESSRLRKELIKALPTYYIDIKVKNR